MYKNPVSQIKLFRLPLKEQKLMKDEEKIFASPNQMESTLYMRIQTGDEFKDL